MKNEPSSDDIRKFEEYLKMKGQKFSLILINDTKNSFQHVIQCLTLYLKHDPLQAEQCAYLTHATGKCAVKVSVEREEIEAYRDILAKQGLTVTIQ